MRQPDNWFERAFGGSLSDIRDRVILGGWFHEVRPLPFGRSPAEQLGWGRPEQPEREPGIDLDRGFDR